MNKTILKSLKKFKVNCVKCGSEWCFGAERLTREQKKSWLCPNCEDNDIAPTIERIGRGNEIKIDCSNCKDFNIQVKLPGGEIEEIIQVFVDPLNNLSVGRGFMIPNGPDDIDWDYEEFYNRKL